MPTQNREDKTPKMVESRTMSSTTELFQSRNLQHPMAKESPSLDLVANEALVLLDRSSHSVSRGTPAPEDRQRLVTCYLQVQALTQDLLES